MAGLLCLDPKTSQIVRWDLGPDLGGSITDAYNFPKLIFQQFQKIGQDLLQRDRWDKQLFMGQQVLLVLLLKGLSWNPTTFPNNECLSIKPLKKAKTRQNLCKTMEETTCEMTFPI